MTPQKHLLRPLVEQVPVWLGMRDGGSGSVYETSTHRLERPGARVPVFAMWADTDAVPGTAQPVFAVMSERSIIGLTSDRPIGRRVPLGFMASGNNGSMREVFTARARDGSLLHSTVRADTGARGLSRMASLGFTTW
jgi:hypothetical protein